MHERDRLDAYYLFEEEWESYDELYGAFEWEIPGEFNAASYVCDRWADDPERVAILAEEASGRERTFTFRRLRDAANGLAGYLADRGVGRGDRVGVNAPQKPETVVAHLAAWKLGAVTVPLSTLYGIEGSGTGSTTAGRPRASSTGRTSGPSGPSEPRCRRSRQS